MGNLKIGNWLASILAAAIMVAAFSAFGADPNALVGEWKDATRTGKRAVNLTIAPSHIAPGGETPIPYTFTQAGNVYTVQLGVPQAPPMTFTLQDPRTLLMQMEGEQAITLTRVGAPPAATMAEAPAPAAPAAAPQAGLMGAGDGSFAKMILPQGVATRFAPTQETLEQLLNGGWKLTQASGTQGGLMFLLEKSGRNVACLVVPEVLMEGDTALSDCRSLN